MQAATTTTAEHHSPLSFLFARYVAGQIEERSWNAFTEAFDAAEASPQEREAFARFYTDALHLFGSAGVPVPKLDEVTDLLARTRHA